MSGGSERIHRSILALLQIAEEEGVSITRTSLAKMLYFADLRSVENGGAPESGVAWKWMNYGPYSMLLRDSEVALRADGSIEVVDTGRTVSQYAEIILRIKSQPQADIDARFREIVRSCVISYGNMSAKSLSNEAYKTGPMLRAQQTSARGCFLDLTDPSAAAPDVASIMSLVSRALGSFSLETDSGDFNAGMRELHCETESTRKAAFARML